MPRGRTLVLAAALVALAGCVIAEPVVVSSPPPPPPVRVEPVPGPPGPAHVWAPGHWAWRGPRRGYVWVPGRYAVPVQPGWAWVPGYWAPGAGGWIWVEGHWRAR
jgi:hypothetical protein